VEGIRFLTDEKGRKVAVQIDLARTRYRDLWEDIHDHLVADARAPEESVSFDQVKQRLARRKRTGRG
jgi:hypothetical protein